MKRFLIRRSIFSLISLIGATFIVFGLSRVAGDPLLLYAAPEGYGRTPEQIEALEKHLGLDRPFLTQYFIWVGHVLRGDLGRSLSGERRVSSIISEKLPATIQLAVAGWLLATVVGIPLGILSAVKRGTLWDYTGRFVALFGQAIPNFWLAILGVLVFTVWVEWLPSGFRGEGFSPKHFIMPTIVVGTSAMAGYLRMTRSAMLEVLDSEFVKLARAKGVSSNVVIWKHALRNALIQPITISTLLLAGLLNGTLVAEAVFAWPGLGRTMLEAVRANDFPVLTGGVLIFAGIYIVFSFIADILYVVVDPRIRYS
ncbi:MAG: ABC transporter permease [Dehalococcoidia bacterium]